MTLLAALALLGAGCAGGRGKEAVPSWPGPESTGVPAGTPLTPLNGETTLLATPGEVVDGKDVTGCLTVTAGNVTLRHFRVRGCAREPVISVGYGLAGIVIEDCEIDGGFLNPAAAAVGIRADYVADAGRSDHSTFLADGIDAVLLSTGYQSDYHKASDIAAHINLVGIERVIDVAEFIIRRAAER